MPSQRTAEIWQARLSATLGGEPISLWPHVDDPTSVRIALVYRPVPGFFGHFPSLNAIVSLSAGVDHLKGDPTYPPALPVTRLTGPHMAAMLVEYALYCTLRFHRDFDVYESQQASHVWKPHRQHLARDRRIGVMGTGVIGAEIGRAFVRLGFDVSGWARSARDLGFPVLAGRHGLAPFLARSDIVICTLPLTKETRGILGAAAFAAMPTGASLINIGRGELIDEDALLSGLSSGHLRGAALDVFPTEPLPSTSPLWDHPKVLITPHIGGDVLEEWGIEAAADAIRRIRAGNPTQYVYDADRGY